MLPCDLFSQNFLGTLFYLLEPMCCRFNRIENDASSHFHFVSNSLVDNTAQCENLMVFSATQILREIEHFRAQKLQRP